MSTHNKPGTAVVDKRREGVSLAFGGGSEAFGPDVVFASRTNAGDIHCHTLPFGVTERHPYMAALDAHRLSGALALDPRCIQAPLQKIRLMASQQILTTSLFQHLIAHALLHASACLHCQGARFKSSPRL
jgi:hypothetical protein